MISITLADGTLIQNLELNGTMFESKSEISKETFEGNLRSVSIQSDNPDDTQSGLIGEFQNMRVTPILKDKNNTYSFGLYPIPANELLLEQLQGDISYLAMMQDIDIEQ